MSSLSCILRLFSRISFFCAFRSLLFRAPSFRLLCPRWLLFSFAVGDNLWNLQFLTNTYDIYVNELGVERQYTTVYATFSELKSAYVIVSVLIGYVITRGGMPDALWNYVPALSGIGHWTAIGISYQVMWTCVTVWTIKCIRAAFQRLCLLSPRGTSEISFQNGPPGLRRMNVSSLDYTFSQVKRMERVGFS